MKLNKNKNSLELIDKNQKRLAKRVQWITPFRIFLGIFILIAPTAIVIRIIYDSQKESTLYFLLVLYILVCMYFYCMWKNIRKVNLMRYNKTS